MRSVLPRPRRVVLLCHPLLWASPPSARSLLPPARPALLARDPLLRRLRRRRPRPSSSPLPLPLPRTAPPALGMSPAAAPHSGSDASSADAAALSDVLGGDHAGLSATFCSRTGDLVPVPEHLVPPAMVEWGDIPTCLETLASEEWVAEGGMELERTTIGVLPEVGCGIDNLEITKKVEGFFRRDDDATRLEGWRIAARPGREAVAVDRRVGRTLETETLFRVDPEVDDEDDGTTYPRRIRVSLSVDLPPEESGSGEPAPTKLIALRVERRTSPRSTRGEAWSGPAYNSGGLDARTVANAIGRDIVYGDAFAAKRLKGGGDPWDLGGDGAPPVEEALAGRWTRTAIAPDDGRSEEEEVRRTAGDFGGGDGDVPFVALRLPQNVLVRYGRGIVSGDDDGGAWAVEVSHVGAVTVDGEARLQRRIATRSLGGVGLRDGGSLGGITYAVEEKRSTSS